jgi:hypothetical protein
MKTPFALFVGVLAVCLSVAGCKKKPTDPPGGAGQPTPAGVTPPTPGATDPGPEAVWEAVKAANASRNHRAFIECFTPATQKAMAARQAYNFLGVRTIEGGSPERNAELKRQNKPIIDALDKHGLTPEATKGIDPRAGFRDQDKNVEKLAALVKDPAGLWADLQAATKNNPDYPDRPSDEYQGKLTV